MIFSKRKLVHAVCSSSPHLPSHWNAHKDKLNELGSLRFAKETGQELVDFYSSDSLSQGDVEKKAKRGRSPNARALKIYAANKITKKLQTEL